MTWASASGGGGEKIGEVRMFVGEVPDGWEALGWSINSTYDNVFSPAPTFIMAGVHFESSLLSRAGAASHASPSAAMVGAGPDLAMLAFGSIGSSVNAPYRSLNLSSGVAASSQASYAGAVGNIFEQLPDGRAIFAGGFGSSTSTYTNSTVVISHDFVVESRAPQPISSAAGAGGWISDDELAFFTSGTGANAGTLDLRSFAYNINSNSWRQLASSPKDVRAGCVVRFGDDVFIIGGTTAVADGRTVLKYNPTLDTYAVVEWSWPNGVTSVRGMSATRLSSGKYLVMARIVEIGLSGTQLVTVPRLFVVGAGGPEYEIPAPSHARSDFAFLVKSDPLISPPMLVKRLSTGSGLGVDMAYDGNYLIEERDTEFLSKSAVKYARKLP